MAGDDFVSPKMPPISSRTDFFRSLLVRDGGDADHALLPIESHLPGIEAAE